MTIKLINNLLCVSPSNLSSVPLVDLLSSSLLDLRFVPLLSLSPLDPLSSLDLLSTSWVLDFLLMEMVLKNPHQYYMCMETPRSTLNL